jgi:tetratricopeptide (TPR) repeat protein
METMNILDLINSTAGLLSGLGTFLLGVAALWPHIYKWTRRGSKKGREAVKEMRRVRGRSQFLGILLLIISAAIFVTRALNGQGQPLNVELTSQAWDAFNKGDYERAITSAEKCISEFRSATEREQAQLERDHIPVPPKGKVSDQEKKTILARGLLNDVATCFYIKGRSAENLGRKEEAKQAYLAASKLTYARCWDPKGWFWAPSEVSSDRLSLLK